MFELLWVWAETNDGLYSVNQDYSPDFWDVKIKGVSSGKLLHNYGKAHHFSWENPLFLWPLSIADCEFTRPGA